MKKGQVLEGTIEKVEFPNKGVVTVAEEGKSVIVKNGIPGQKVKFCVNKFKRGNAEGRLLEVLEKSPLETRKPVCSIFPVCGGCMYQTMSYEAQMDMKAEQVKNILNEAVNGEYLFEGVKASPKEFAYRNKMEFSFGDEYKDGPLTLGLHKKGSTYDVLTASDCKLVHDDMTKILNCVLEYFKERNVSYYKKMQHTGYLRHLLLRRGDRTGEILVNLVTTTQEEHDMSPLKEALLNLELEGKIVGFLHILNDSLSDVVQSDETRIIYGQDYFYEKLLNLEFKITPFSFFQPNSRGAEVLYSTVRDYIGDINDMTVFDLFSGTGTIAQVLAPVAKQVIGVEIIEEAVEAAKENAAHNGLSNCKFIAGQMKRRNASEAVGDDGLTTMQKHVLKHILLETMHREVYQKDIEEEFQIRKSTATGILQLMEKNGFISRESSKKDARLKRIVPTPKAEALRPEILEHIRDTEKRLIQGIDQEDVKICRKVLVQMIQNLAENKKENKEEDENDE